MFVFGNKYFKQSKVEFVEQHLIVFHFIMGAYVPPHTHQNIIFVPSPLDMKYVGFQTLETRVVLHMASPKTKVFLTTNWS